MPARNSYQCTNCGALAEGFGGPPAQRCFCGRGAWQLVFTEMPQMRTAHASAIDACCSYNERLTRTNVEIASTPGTDEYKELEDVRHAIAEHIPSASRR